MTQLPGAVSRRRFITVAAAAAGIGCLPVVGLVKGPPTIIWSGIALGAPARLTLQCSDEQRGREAIAACLSEIARLEAIFSLHRPDSALVRLNAEGVLEDAPADLRMLVAQSMILAARTDGAFDPTIQPLWKFRAGRRSDRVAAWDSKELALIRELVGWRNVHIEGGTIRLSKPGMALSLNGIAQGYITDKVGDLLRERGFEHVLVDMGEQLALGPKWDGSAWRVGVSVPAQPLSLVETIMLSEGAVATSSNLAQSADGQNLPHIIDPKTGEPAARWWSVTVVAKRATEADGLSTALSVLPLEKWRAATSDKVRIFAVPVNAREGFWIS